MWGRFRSGQAVREGTLRSLWTAPCGTASAAAAEISAESSGLDRVSNRRGDSLSKPSDPHIDEAPPLGEGGVPTHVGAADPCPLRIPTVLVTEFPFQHQDLLALRVPARFGSAKPGPTLPNGLRCFSRWRKTHGGRTTRVPRRAARCGERRCVTPHDVHWYPHALGEHLVQRGICGRKGLSRDRHHTAPEPRGHGSVHDHRPGSPAPSLALPSRREGGVPRQPIPTETRGQ